MTTSKNDNSNTVCGFLFHTGFSTRIQTKKNYRNIFKLYLYCRSQPSFSLRLSWVELGSVSLYEMYLSSVKFEHVLTIDNYLTITIFMCYLLHSLTVTGSTQPSLSGPGKSKNTLWTFVIICEHCRLCVYESENFRKLK